jgi:protein tyrosine/serine phosphatase
MPSAPEVKRIIELDGCLNFRDLGGYKTQDGRHLRTGQLFRSDALHYMTETDVRTVRDEIGVRVVIDLRSSGEIRSEGTGPLSSPPMAYHHLPLFDGTQDVADLKEVPIELDDQYLFILRTAQGPISQVLRILANAPTPAVFHCAAGKDRTGVISALLLSLLGVSEKDIVEDYVFTSLNLDQIVQRLQKTPGYQEIFERLPPSTLHARPETMVSFLSGVRRTYGSMQGYARAAGIDEATVSALERKLLEGA